jgi:hypothetical protein
LSTVRMEIYPQSYEGKKEIRSALGKKERPMMAMFCYRSLSYGTCLNL